MKFFESQGRGGRSIFCGSTFSLLVNELGLLYLFGQNKKTGEANMYPKPVQDLAGKLEVPFFFFLSLCSYIDIASFSRMEHNTYWLCQYLNYDFGG